MIAIEAHSSGEVCETRTRKVVGSNSGLTRPFFASSHDQTPEAGKCGIFNALRGAKRRHADFEICAFGASQSTILRACEHYLLRYTVRAQIFFASKKRARNAYFFYQHGYPSIAMCLRAQPITGSRAIQAKTTAHRHGNP